MIMGPYHAGNASGVGWAGESSPHGPLPLHYDFRLFPPNLFQPHLLGNSRGPMPIGRGTLSISIYSIIKTLF
jgi:hypothetical protein